MKTFESQVMPLLNGHGAEVMRTGESACAFVHCKRKIGSEWISVSLKSKVSPKPAADWANSRPLGDVSLGAFSK